MQKVAVGNAENYIVSPLTRRTSAVQIKNISRRLLAGTCLILTDLAGVIIALLIAYQIRLRVLPTIFPIFPHESPPQLSVKIWWILGLIFICLAYERLYTRRLPFWRETKKIIAVINLSFIMIFAGVSLAKLGGEVSRTVLVLGYIFALILIPLDRYLLKSIMAVLGIWQEYVLILGTDSTARKIAAVLNKDNYMGYRIYGFLGNSSGARGKIRVNAERIPVYGGFEDAERILKETGIQQVIIAAPTIAGKKLVHLTHQLQPYTRSILVVPDLCGIPVIDGETEYFFEDHILGFRTHNNLANPINVWGKRLFDIVVGSIILIGVLPVLAVIAAAIKLDSPGPVGFSHRRVGHNGNYFNLYKFRSMVANSQELLEDLLRQDPELKEEWEGDFKLKDDPRITRVGRFLRKTSLDELPQIFNVIKGDMSLVGPRPIVEEEIDKFDEYIKEYYMVLPGITGLWAVSGRNDIEYDERVQMETWYVRNWSLWLDISLLFRTIPVVLGKKGAY
ncbi:MAG: undecaprenyl-phosphate galactose phosphotransferase WbaP [Syntrophomonadaceae bacterium]|nr:undecaprenyl-phosphate galactose phosphotransferase WbaP [Syntrophomonadaceae bacterium]